MKNVLGINSVVRPYDGAGTIAEGEVSASSKKSILVVDSSPWNSAARELFVKMLAAMKIPEAEVQIIFTNEVSGADLPVRALACQYVICFADKQASDFSVEDPHFTKTISPSILVQKADLKRQAWEDLKSALVKMGRS